MPRDWYPMRLFVRENGRPYPTVLFWLFLIPVMMGILAGCYLVLDRRAEQTRVAAALTQTPTVLATETSAPVSTPTPAPPMGEPTPTEYVYDDPSGWEFIERTDPSGTTYLDLQDWQKEQVWHAFEEFWNLRYRAENGLTPLEEIEPYTTGRYLEAVQFDYEYINEHGQYVYVLQPLSEIERAMILQSVEGREVRVRVVLVSDFGFLTEVRDPETGEVLETNTRFPYKTWNFILIYLDGRWVVEDSTGTGLD